jgi:hypothetical protein
MSMKIWRLVPEGHKDVVLRTPLKYFQNHFVGRSMIVGWQAPEIDARAGRGKRIPDFVSWMLTAPVISPRARQVLEPLIAPHVEILPLLKLRGSDLWAVNVMTLVDCLDEDRSEVAYSPDDGRIMNVVTFGFKEHCVPDVPIFKLASYPADVFVTRSFVDQVLAAGLHGAAFGDPAVNPFPLILKGKSLNVVKPLRLATDREPNT